MLYYITSNKAKVRVAEKYLSPLDIAIQGEPLDLVELQSDDIAQIAIDKAKQAFSVIKQPLFVNDAGWYITALNGFPGPFMKYMNDWLTAQDILAMMAHHSNREVIFREVICYIDADQVKPFIGEVKGRVLSKDTVPSEVVSRSVFSLSSNQKSIAECWQEGVASVDNYAIWKDFANWYESVKSPVLI
jgi:non-canonical purine NTP pyrophosphatase (RdgB/HAM1 family)